MKEINVRELLSLVGNNQTVVIIDHMNRNTVFSGAAVAAHGAILDRVVKFMSCTGDSLKLEI